MAQYAPAGRSAITIKSHNRRILLVAMLRGQPISRVRLARCTGLSTTTVTNLVTELLNQGVVQEVGMDREAASKGAGRPPLALSLVPRSRYCIGVHIGVRRIKVALCDLLVEVVQSALLPVEPNQPAAVLLAQVAATVRILLQRQGLTLESPEIVGVGVGASGLVDLEQGVNVLAPNLGWRHVPIRQILVDALHVPVAVDNNVRCMALAESLHGAGKEARALAFVYARIGVGAGLVVDGEIYRGAGYGAGEIGHWIMLMQPDATDVSLESLISERTMVEAVAAQIPELMAGADRSIDAVFAAARNDVAGVRPLLEGQARYLGIALANLVDVFNPQLVLLGGFLADGFDLFHATLAATMASHAFGGLGNSVQLKPTTFGAQCGEIGAAALGFDQFFLRAPR